MNENFKKYIVDYLLIIIGTFLLAIGLNTFLLPFKLSSGGISSIATILFHMLSIPLWVTNLLFNMVLFVLGYKFLGGESVVKTVAGIVFLSVFLHLTTYMPYYTDDVIIATIVGGIFVGMGVGLVVRREASTGGSDFAALILHKFFPHISVANLILVIDFSIIIIAGLIFGSITVTCYSAISLFISMKISDIICTSGESAKAVYIMSEKYDEIAKEIMGKFERGVTGIYSKGMYSDADKMTLFCVVAPKQMPQIIELSKRIDKDSFVIISDARGVYGEGFLSYK